MNGVRLKLPNTFSFSSKLKQKSKVNWKIFLGKDGISLMEQAKEELQPQATQLGEFYIMVEERLF